MEMVARDLDSTSPKTCGSRYVAMLERLTCRPSMLDKAVVCHPGIRHRPQVLLGFGCWLRWMVLAKPATGPVVRELMPTVGCGEGFRQLPPVGRFPGWPPEGVGRIDVADPGVDDERWASYSALVARMVAGEG